MASKFWRPRCQCNISIFSIFIEFDNQFSYCFSECSSLFRVYFFNIISPHQITCVVLKRMRHQTNSKQMWCWDFFINWRALVPHKDTSCCQLIHPEKSSSFYTLLLLRRFSTWGNFFLSYLFGNQIGFWNINFFVSKLIWNVYYFFNFFSFMSVRL